MPKLIESDPPYYAFESREELVSFALEKLKPMVAKTISENPKFTDKDNFEAIWKNRDEGVEETIEYLWKSHSEGGGKILVGVTEAHIRRLERALVDSYLSFVIEPRGLGEQPTNTESRDQRGSKMPDDIIAYPFLGSANVDYEYRGVTKAAELPEVISAYAPEDSSVDDILRKRVIGTDGAPYTLIFRAVPAVKADGTKYSDRFGRQIFRNEGLIIKGHAEDIPIRAAHLDQAHDLLTPYFEEFWAQTKQQYGNKPPLLQVKETVTITPNDAKEPDVITSFKDRPLLDARPEPDAQPVKTEAAPKWRPFLYSCNNHSSYGFTALSSEDSAAANAMLGNLPQYPEVRDKGANKWIIGVKNNRVFFGRYAPLEEFFDPEHPMHKVDPRRLECFIGYTAPAGTTLPSVEELKQLDSTIAADIERLWKERNIIRREHVKDPTPTTFDFSGDKSDHPWDQAATAITANRSSATLIMTNEGKTRPAKSLETSRDTEPTFGTQEENRAKHRRYAEHRRNEREKSENDFGTTALVAGLAGGAAAIAGGIGMLSGKKSEQAPGEPQQKSWVRKVAPWVFAGGAVTTLCAVAYHFRNRGMAR